jgi:DNA topoisomerase VI subunit B
MKRKNDKEAVSQKSAAEFFSEHQQIAGFDNPGKSLFTTIREFVENSLDGTYLWTESKFLLFYLVVCMCDSD